MSCTLGVGCGFSVIETLITMIIFLYALWKLIGKNHQKKKFLIVSGISILFIIRLFFVIPTNYKKIQNTKSNEINKEYICTVLAMTKNIFESESFRGWIVETHPPNKKIYGRVIQLKNEFREKNINALKKIKLIVTIADQDLNCIVINDARKINFKNETLVQHLAKEERIVNDQKTIDSVGFGWAMLTGSKELISTCSMRAFFSTGTMHLFAVSGLHIGFFYIIISTILKPFQLNTVLLMVLKMVICLIYLFYIDYPHSAMRAFIMISFFDFCKFMNVKQKSTTFFNISIIAILFFDPAVLFSLSAQLSYTVVLFILFSLPGKSKPKTKIELFLDNVLRFFIISISASAGSALLVLDYFNYFPFLSVITNIFIAPFIFVFYVTNVLFFACFLFFESCLLLNLHVFLYEIINFIIQSILKVNSRLPAFTGMNYEIINFSHFFLFLSLLLCSCFRVKQKFKISSVFLYYSFIWVYCLLISS
ncbi:MAG: ComEC/Rec2 family competence protein [Opitutae bacterium]